MTDYHIVMANDGKKDYAIADANSLWSDALDAVAEVIERGHSVLFVHHIRRGMVEDRTETAIRSVIAFAGAIA